MVPSRRPRKKKNKRAPEHLALAFGIALALVGCGGEAPPARAVGRTPPHGTNDAGADAAGDGQREEPTAARIAASGPAVAPGMREHARFDESAPLDRDVVRGAEKDTCARIAFAATASVRASLVDGTGAPIVELPAAASGLLGTACARRGDVIVLRVIPEADAAVTRLRGVVWLSP